MPSKTDGEIEKIEANQAELRRSIQRTKELAEKTDKLLDQHKAGSKQADPTD